MSGVSITISAKDLVKRYESGFFSKHKTYALNGVDIEIKKRETYSLIGESGCGKSTLGRVLLKLTHLSEGKIIFNGEDITDKSPKDLLALRRKMQIIPQHPEDSFNPRWKISRSILEPYHLHPDLSDNIPLDEMLIRLLKYVGLDRDYAERYPHQLSGGELQRAVIARAILFNPDFIVCDEPTSMLDVSVQASIIHLLRSVQKQTGVSLLFITHDIRLAGVVGDRTGVMYKGLIVEEGADILSSPSHPYTRALIENISPEKKFSEPGGFSECPWIEFCQKYDEKCRVMPDLKMFNGVRVRCHYPGN